MGRLGCVLAQHNALTPSARDCPTPFGGRRALPPPDPWRPCRRDRLSKFQKHAWLIFFVMGVGALLGAPILLLGNPPDPPSPATVTGLTKNELAERIPGLPRYISSISRQLGNFILAFGVLLVAIAAVPFRKAERWAWYALWVVPVMLLIQFINSDFGLGWWLDLGLVPVTLAGLLLPYRRFFPKGPR